MKISLAAALLLGLVQAAPSDHWAVLVAGSSGYSNYRHQADICHAYHIMLKNGIPADQIITMAYDDIAHNSENPFPGKIFNKPNGSDVYSGCKIDYSGKHVTPENFLAILKGNASGVTGGNGKVLKSNKKSKVFVNFADHGAPGLIAFPSTYLYADDFNSAITYMHQKQMYEKMVIYIEACESGSMFDGLLPSNISVYATTAANDSESSYATYCYPQDMVNGKHINSCLGDLYSVNWMEDTEANDYSSETFTTQFLTVKSETSQSHVQEFGETDFKNLPIGDFQGDLDQTTIFFNRLLTSVASDLAPTKVSVDSRNARLSHLYAKTLEDGGHKAHIDLSTEINDRMRADHVFETFTGGFVDGEQFPLPRNFDCLRTLMTSYESSCGKFSDYSLKYVKYLVKSCETSNETMENTTMRLRQACTH